MMPFNRRSLLTGTMAAMAVGLGACGSSPQATQSTSAPAPSENSQEPAPATSPTTESSPSASPQPSASPSPSGSSDSLMPKTSHNRAAAEYAYPSEKVQAWMKDPSSAPEKSVFLTFDDGPNHSNSVQILDALKAGGVHGTFFVIGKLVSSAPETLKREIAEGHSVAMHSYTHNYDKLYPGRAGSLEAIKGEYEKTKEALEEVLGSEFKTNTWRYPGGHMSWKKLEAADEALAAEGVHWIDWNCLTGDAEPKNRQPKDVAGMVKMATSAISEGLKVSVMLAHDAEGKDMTVKAMPQIISAYKEAGYKFGVIA